MSPELAAALNLILGVLCDIRACLRKLCEQPGCTPAPYGGPDPKMTTKALSTTATKILGIDPNRIAFVISNVGNAMDVYISPTPAGATSAVPTGKIAAGAVGYFTGYQYPTSVPGEWYAKSASGTPTIGIQEELTTK
jgi:hypothetical protein